VALEVGTAWLNVRSA
jgi:outer membrane protein TolC